MRLCQVSLVSHKFGGIIFLCHRVIMVRAFVLVEFWLKIIKAKAFLSFKMAL